MVKLTPRLQAIADMASGSTCLADIGTDHGYLPIYLVHHERISKAIASDLNKAPLESARTAVEEAGFEEEIELRLGSGLDPFEPGEADVIVMAGMGGVLMSELLNAGEKVARSAKFLILQPMQAPHELRLWLVKSGYTILQERAVREGDKYYEIMKVVSGDLPQLTWQQLHLGYAMVNDQDYRDFLNHKRTVQERIIAGLEKGQRHLELIDAKAAMLLIEAAIEKAQAQMQSQIVKE